MKRKETLKKKKTVKKTVKKKNKITRISTEKRKKLLIKKLKESLGIITTACAKADIGRVTFYRWYKEDLEFKESVDEIEDIALDFVETQHYKLIRDGNPASIIFHLKTKGRLRGYREKYELEHSGDIGIEEIKSSIREFLDDENK